ncbi:hypothetical protein BDW02DRAFT_50321 [Decorospora gaudefroyi]|uniref:Uncharacterized protein n=1 Tax=Decorospora gaudefroyi TaxID=184978 RepID=A0A6A5KLW2_9PLEO|nr:hypothetical protein BDW02DRAFT_50321 [Decorospora gaudefroyi]
MALEGGVHPSMAMEGPPYPAMVWPLGGAPVKHVDIPAQSVFMFFFLVGAAVHMKIFQKNRARGHKFLPSLFIFLFCMSRIITSILRIALVCNPRDVSLAIATQIFVAAGVLILFIINLIFAMRLVRSTHPSLGWHPAISISFKVLCALVGLTLVAVIAATVQSFYTLDANARATCLGLQRYGATFLAIIAVLPLPVTALTLLIPHSPLDRFGIGRLRTKVVVLLISTTLLSLGAWYRSGVALQTPVPRTQPLPGYLGKAPFYIFNFLVEIQTVLMYAILRVDLRWHVPNGAKGPGSYAKTQKPEDVELQVSRPTSANTTQDDLDIVSLKQEEEKELVIEKTPLPPTRANTLQVDNPQSESGSIVSERLSSFFAKSTNTLASLATPEQKQRWRESEEARIVRRLGGPWQQLASPTESTFRKSVNSATESTLSPDPRTRSIAYPQKPQSVHTRSDSGAPSIPDVVGELNEGGWTPRIDWDFRSPRRFLSLKKRSMIGLQVGR